MHTVFCLAVPTMKMRATLTGLAGAGFTGQQVHGIKLQSILIDQAIISSAIHSLAEREPRLFFLFGKAFRPPLGAHLLSGVSIHLFYSTYQEQSFKREDLSSQQSFSNKNSSDVVTLLHHPAFQLLPCKIQKHGDYLGKQCQVSLKESKHISKPCSETKMTTS